MEAEFVELAREMMRSTHARDEGCIAYTIHAKDGAPREFVLYEQWRDQEAVDKHLQRLLADVGRERFVGYFEKTEAVRLTPIE
jgi:quinol monooxygenase YgiN